MKKRIIDVGQVGEKIIVIGSPGAGKSNFARRLRDKTNLPLYYLDMLWHKADKTNVSKEELDAKLNDIIQREKWILDGNHMRTMARRFEKCDTVFLLDYPLDVCISGVESRIGKEREDMPWVESEFDEKFKQWIIHFPEKQLPLIYELIQKYKNEKNIIIFKSRAEADDYLNVWRVQEAHKDVCINTLSPELFLELYSSVGWEPPEMD